MMGVFWDQKREGGYTPVKKKRPITIVLTEEVHAALVKMAEKESRPVAQMARVLIEKAVEKRGDN